VSLSEVREKYEDESGKASDLVRQLAFAGIAVIWVFSGSSLVAGRLHVPSDLIWPGILLVSALTLDFLQYATGASIWGGYGRILEKHDVADDEEIDYPAWINWPALLFFWGKQLLLLIAYGLLLAALFNRLG
jgi:hypothetical protein